MNFRKFIPLLFLVLLCKFAYAQLEVKKGSFKEVPGFVNINTDKMYDDNDKPYAVLKIKTENIDGKQRRELNFGGDAQTFFEVEYKDGEVWLYISYYASYIKISHDDLSSVEFYFPFDMQPKKGYEMTLVNKVAVPIVPVKDVYNYMIVSADQPNAAIYIDNVFEGEKEVYKSFMAGEKHSWRIECPLYHSETGEITIPSKEGENVTMEKTLRPAHGFISVTSTPESDAIVYIDGNKVGQTPYTSDKIASGEHKVRVVKEMYSAVEKTFTVTDGNTTRAALTMSANFVNVSITTDADSDIYVDNEKKGKGSWSGRLGDGPHGLEARKASHKSSIKNIQLTLGKNETVVIPDPTPIYGTLDVASNPMGANIIIDGKSYGTTPRVLTNVLIGSHELRLEKSGCAGVTKSFTLDETNKLTINEKLATGREMTISTDGAGDKIYVDGNYVGVSPFTTTLSFGSHNVKAVRGDKESKQTVTVAQSGGDTNVKLMFSDNRTFTVNGVSFEMVAVKGGTFTMGCTDEQGGDCEDDESPSHSVTLNDYYIGKFEVTQKLWKAVMGSNPSNFKGDDLPVEQVSWNDCKEFIGRLNQLTGANFRLPTEAEWEYAARGGAKSHGYKYSGSNSIADVAVYDENSYNKGSNHPDYGTHNVGTKSPNELGIYDMSGNVCEWCEDWYGDYSGGSQTNPKGPSSGSRRVLRGGSWHYFARNCRVSYRNYYDPDYRHIIIGFRLALVH